MFHGMFSAQLLRTAARTAAPRQSRSIVRSISVTSIASLRKLDTPQGPQTTTLESSSSINSENETKETTAKGTADADVHSTITPSVDQSLDVNPLTGKTRTISKDLQKGSFHMLKDLNTNKGKLFLAHRLDSSSPPMPWPEMPGLTSLLSTSPPTFPPPSPHLICVSFKQFGFDMLPSWTSSLPPTTPTLQLVIGDGGILKLFQGFLTSSLKKVIPENKWEHTYMYNGEHGRIREMLNIENTLTGFVFYTVGGKVVWRGCGIATEEKKKKGKRAGW
ncbi:hypothetical protein TrVE_jg1180 [Triparma verrucosa]|uniref:Uncharacterized protein n=1 Tax=Triparma verrucosa TaxID=1606542 RepID=A0A9W7C172_9STRA|nr:hypothetical protein TrVE_jg1180 [Triparma verrucosa]